MIPQFVLEYEIWDFYQVSFRWYYKCLNYVTPKGLKSEGLSYLEDLSTKIKIKKVGLQKIPMRNFPYCSNFKDNV